MNTLSHANLKLDPHNSEPDFRTYERVHIVHTQCQTGADFYTSLCRYAQDPSEEYSGEWLADCETCLDVIACPVCNVVLY